MKNKFLQQILQNRRRSAGYLLFVLYMVSCTHASEYKVAHAASRSQDSIQQELLAKRAWNQLKQLKPVFETGDLITRTGNDFTSESLRNFNDSDNRYSHIGMISIENDSILVYHALGGEFNPDQRIMRDPLSHFAEPYGNRGIGLFRLTHRNHHLSQKMVQEARNCYLQKIPFDLDFDLKTNDKLYCAEMISKCIELASDHQIHFTTNRIGTFEYIAVDQIFRHPAFHEILALRYK